MLAAACKSLVKKDRFVLVSNEQLRAGHLQLVTTDSPQKVLHGDDAVETARAESFKVERDEFKAQKAEGLNQFATELELDEAGKSSRGTSMRARSPLW